MNCRLPICSRLFRKWRRPFIIKFLHKLICQNIQDRFIPRWSWCSLHVPLWVVSVGSLIRKSVRVRPLLSYHYLPLSSVKILSRCIRMVHWQTRLYNHRVSFLARQAVKSMYLIDRAGTRYQDYPCRNVRSTTSFTTAVGEVYAPSRRYHTDAIVQLHLSS